MKRTNGSIGFYRFFIPLSLLICGALMLPSTCPSWGGGSPQTSQNQTDHHGPRIQEPTPQEKTSEPELSARQKQNLLKTNFEKTKDDASQLADMANGLRDELNKTNVNILSVDVIHRAEKIEKLARKIREEAKGY